MAIHLKSVAVAVMQCIFFTGLAAGQECCRSLDRPPRYAEAAIHPNPAQDSTVISVGSRGIVVQIPTFVIDPYFGGRKFKYLHATGDGITWAVTAGDHYSPIMTPTIDLIAAPSDNKTLYRKAGTVGLYLRSDDGGRTWTLPSYNVDGQSKEMFVYALTKDHRYFMSSQIVTVDPQNPLTVYASLAAVPWGVLFGSIALPIRPSEHVYMSHDGGNNWTEFGATLSPTCPLALSPSNPKVMIGCENSGLVQSNDGGLNWQPILEQRQLQDPPVVQEEGHKPEVWSGWSGLTIRQISFDPGNDGIIYLVTNKGIYRSMDGAHTWCLLDLGFDEIDAVNNLAISEVRTTEIVVGTHYGVFRSTDRGCHFLKIYPTAKNVEDLR